METLTQNERNELVTSLYDLWDQAYPGGGGTPPSDEATSEFLDRYYQRLGEYLDRLPREILSVCPFTGDPLRRTLDPWGFDGPFWHSVFPARIEEPRASPHFLVLLGGVALRRDEPTETRTPVLPGPDVPFVVPALLELEGVVAVISRVELATGDIAYPVAYFAEDPEKIEPIELHQPWLREDYWFRDENGNVSWSISNDVWDFDLEKWLRSGKLRWADVTQDEPRAERLGAEDPVDRCPWAAVEGRRVPQSFSDGKRSWLPLPTGDLVFQFEDSPGAPPSEDELKQIVAAHDAVVKESGGLAGLKAQVERDDSMTPEQKAEWRRMLADIEKDL